MLTYDSLTKFQKRWVENVSRIFPRCAETGIITAKECIKAYSLLKNERSDDGSKIGYPNWLFTTNKLKRGVYLFPAKGVTTQTVSLQSKEKTEVKPLTIPERDVHKDDKQFFDDLASHGIDVLKKN